MSKVDIVQYQDEYYNDLRRLSYEWLEKYVSVEPEDERILNNPKEVILDNGGRIFFAKCGEEIVGTVSLIRVDEKIYELAKLAVTEKFQGLKIGNKLMEKCIQVANEEKIKEIILYTNHKLISAIKLYEKFGFKHIPLINNKYLESDLKMMLEL
ncbi:GNAT family N-acetyltransferase [Tissierella praeacuta]|uniref:GNAT family N-acetyltransferase n=1 Tax=Tissierella praeacuta TaxID=43131 RepID=UPI0033404951